MEAENIKATTTITKRPATRSHASESPFKTIQTIEKRFEKLSLELTETIKETICAEVKKIEAKIVTEFNKEFANLKDQLRREVFECIEEITNKVSTVAQRVEQIEKQYFDTNKMQSEIVVMKSTIAELNTKQAIHENEVVACDLRITGVPWYAGEKLEDVLSNICSTLNIDMPCYKYIYRSKSHNNSPDSAIIVKLDTPMAKVHVLKSINYFRKTNKTNHLSLDLIGFDSNQIFYVNESLSSTNYKIFRNALRYKKQNMLSKVFTRRGIVNVIQLPNDKPRPIYSLNDLDTLFRS